MYNNQPIYLFIFATGFIIIINTVIYFYHKWKVNVLEGSGFLFTEYLNAGSITEINNIRIIMYTTNADIPSTH